MKKFGTERQAKAGMSWLANTDQEWHWHPPADGAGQEPEAKAVQGRTSTDSRRPAYGQARHGIFAK